MAPPLLRPHHSWIPSGTYGLSGIWYKPHTARIGLDTDPCPSAVAIVGVRGGRGPSVGLHQQQQSCQDCSHSSARMS
eukprot:4368398-Pyramimonas_sp.AAC.1